MRNEEQLLSYYSAIVALRDTGCGIKQIAQDFNEHLGIQITQRQLRYLVDRVQTNKIHKEYNRIAVINDDAFDVQLYEYCVYFKDLLITFKSAVNAINPKYIITPKNITNLYSQTSLLYAKRLLKLYHISDIELLKQHKVIYPNQPDIDLDKAMDKINIDFNNEFATMMIELKNKYVQFIAKNIIKSCANAS